MATLEQTLEQMVESNMAYSRSHKPVNEKRAFAERAKLREELDRVYDRLKFKRQEERGVAGDVAQAEARVRQLQEEEADLTRMVGEVERRRAEAQAAVQVRRRPQQTTLCSPVLPGWIQSTLQLWLYTPNSDMFYTSMLTWQQRLVLSLQGREK